VAEQRLVDIAAVTRVARRVDLRDIRLVDLKATLLSEDREGPLSGNTEYKCSHKTEPGLLAVDCGYAFSIHVSAKQVAEIKATYRMFYDLKGSEVVADSDLSEFASTNGVYHSWPFLRQLVADHTARLGFSPYTLPVFLVSPALKAAPDKPVAQVAQPPEKVAGP
jgi:hypothetical protein